MKKEMMNLLMLGIRNINGTKTTVTFSNRIEEFMVMKKYLKSWPKQGQMGTASMMIGFATDKGFG